MAYNEKIKFMTYNVWSNEHVAVYRRIQAISKLIVRHEPHVIFLQIYEKYITVDRKKYSVLTYG
ncbi:hypothetical protein OsJ_24404 [Oryza sativa Japonica Group]|uniref:Endonuclease/exonuclease/phosphatase domain-containing protein n=1 Tax=Oryza sativa subsp. japonica TaxID=39947 RepID=A3BK79_ORYSJ|nr:hypothetical protein OsJ_24404 [Oryza sativa Japonica Group]